MPYNIPMDWLGKPADPAAHYSQGFQIGVRLGAEQAANQYRQQQILLEQQKMAFENQYAQQKQALEVADVIQKQRATAAYQGMISQGVDPMRALQFVGPSLGIDPSRIAAIEESRMERAAQLQANQQRWSAQLSLDTQEEARRQKQYQDELAERKRQFDATQKFKSEQKDVVPVVEEYGGRTYLRNPKTGHVELIDRTIRKPDFVARNITRWMSDTGLGREEAVKEIENFYDSHIAPVSEKTRGVEGGAILPDRETGRVRMRSPEGKTGTLPSDQVEAAIREGWTRL